MVLRSCLCYKRRHVATTQKRSFSHLYIKQQQLYHDQQLALSKLTVRKYPGSLLHYPQQRMFASSVNSIGKDIEKIDISSSFSNQQQQKQHYNNNLSNDLDRVLNNQLSIKQTKAFYRRLATTATPPDIYTLFSAKLTTLDYHSLRKVLLDAAAYWPVETIHKVMALCDGKFVEWRLDLLTMILSGYVINRKLDPVLKALPDTSKSERKDLLPFYNAILNKCSRQKELEHVRLVVDLMKEKGVKPDTATFNILVRLKLNNNETILDPEQSFNMYADMIAEGIKPNNATFNTFIKHACRHEQWDAINTWLDMMEEDDVEANPITARILFQTYVNNPQVPQLCKAFDRVSNAVPLVEKERFLNTGVSALLKSKQTKAAMNLLDKTFALDEPLSVYSYNLLLRALCLDGKLTSAQEVLNTMISQPQQQQQQQQQDSIPKPDIVSFTTTIHGLVRNSNHVQLDQLNTLYKQVIDQGLRTNNVLESVMMYGLVRSDNLSKAKIMFESIMANKQQMKTPRQHADTSLNEIVIYNMMMDFYFIHYHKSKTLKHQTPQEPFALLEDAVEKKKLKPTVSTLNILVRGLAILNKDLNAAEKMVTLLSDKGVEMNEKTVWYLTKAAYKQGHMNRARQWIQTYESKHNRIKGTGLLHLKSILTKWDEKEKIEK